MGLMGPVLASPRAGGRAVLGRDPLTLTVPSAMWMVPDGHPGAGGSVPTGRDRPCLLGPAWLRLNPHFPCSLACNPPRAPHPSERAAVASCLGAEGWGAGRGEQTVAASGMPG